MARKHRLPCSRLVGVDDVRGRKLIIFMLLQLVLSPFVLITADTLNESTNNNQTAQMLNAGKQQFGSASNGNANVNNVKTNCTGDDSFLTQSTEPTLAASGKSANGNSISERREIDANGETRPYDDDLSLTGNASIRNQSGQTITASDTKRAKREDGNFNKDGERVLSRKRRYLIFPPGSSMQIVYDTYQPIVGYSNYLILGITAAMAWELPSKPIYYDEELRDKYEMGDAPLLHRNDNNLTNAQYVLPSKNANNLNRINSNYYYTNIPAKKIAYDKSQYQSPYKTYYQSGGKPSYSAPASSNHFQQYVSYADGLMKQFKKLTQTIPQDRPLSTKDFQEFANIIAKNVKNPNPNYRKRTNYAHIIHPVFKKRSIDDMTPLERFDVKIHRNSRHALYKQINTFLKTQGSDGDECVLKTLCEVGQRKHNTEPGSMVVELLRAVFTLPEPVDEPTGHPQHKRYDDAHASTEDCQNLYPKCKESVWNSKYM